MMNRIYRKLPQFSDELERQYQIRYKQTPYEAYVMIVKNGVACEEAFAFIQEEMDSVWKEYRAQKQEESRQNTFHSVSDNETPFSFTDTENDILNHIYQEQGEQPLCITPEYDMHGEQLRHSFT